MRHDQLTDDLQEQASLYAAGAMPESERAEYLRHIEDDRCAVCRAEVNELQAAIGNLAFSVNEASPSPGVRGRLLEQARNSVFASRPAPSFLRRNWFAFAAASVAVASLVTLMVATRANDELRRMTDTLVSRINALELQISQQRTYLASFTDPESRVIDLTGTGSSAGARARIFWNTDERTWRVFVQDLPRVTDDKIYQLWFVPKSGNPVSASAFNTEANGSRELEIRLGENLTDLRQAAVTTELAPGQPQPTGSFALLSPTG